MGIRNLLLATALLLPAGSVLADGDAAAGAAIFKKCQACHTATQPINKVGPSLMGVIGRPVATAPDYNYSEAMKAFGAGKSWDEATFSTYIKAPRFVVKGTKMAFPGLKKDEDIANLIAYLKNPAATP